MKKLIRSEREKECIDMVVKEAERLPYPTKQMEDDVYETEELYIIPEENKKTLLYMLWPFMDRIQWDDILWDIHEEAYTYFKDCLIIRWNNRNVIVSEFYFHSGGTMLDIVRPPEWEGGNVITQTLKEN